MKKYYMYVLCFCLLQSNFILANRINVSNASGITSAMSTVVPGDTLVMQDGVWNNQLINFGGANGTAVNPIVLIAATPGNVYLEGLSRVRIYGNYLEVNGITFQNCNQASFGTNAVVEFRNGSTLASHSRLTNCYVNNYNADNAVDNKWISLYGTYNRVDHCHFEGKSNYGATLTVWYQSAGGFPNESPETHHTIEYNYFTNRTLPNGGNGGETIRVGDSNTSRTNGYNMIAYNLFENCDGEIETISNKSEFNTYAFNTFRGNAGGLTLRHGANCTVKGNFFFGEGDPLSTGVRIIDGGHTVYNNYFQDIEGGNGSNLRSPIVIMNGQSAPAANGYWPVYSSNVFNNTMVNCMSPSIIIGSVASGGTVPPTTLKIANNIIYSTDGPLVEYVNTPTSTTQEGNMYFGAALGNPTSGWTNVNPLLVFDNNTYRLSASSPAINASVGTYSPVTDYDGQNRTGINDVGCDEYTNSAGPIAPLGPTEVGVCWLSGGNIPCFSLIPALPVELISFTGTYQNKSIKIEWSVANEERTEVYELEHRYVSEQWTKIAAVTPNPDEHLYTVSDPEALPGIHYYRLKMIDSDQKFVYSPTVAVMVSAPKQTIKVYPSLLRSDEPIYLATQATILEAGFYDLDGRFLSKAEVDSVGDEGYRIKSAIPFTQTSWVVLKVYLQDGTVQAFKIGVF